MAGEDSWFDAYAANGNEAGLAGLGPAMENGSPAYSEINWGGLGAEGDPNNNNGSGGLNDEFLKNIGWTGGNPYHVYNQRQNDGGSQEMGPGGVPLKTGYDPAFIQYLRDKGITLKQRADGMDHAVLQAFGPDGQQIGTPMRAKIDPDNQFGFAILAAATIATAGIAAAGAAGTAGVAGAEAAASGSAAGTGMAGAGSAAGVGGAAAGGGATTAAAGGAAAAGGGAAAAGGGAAAAGGAAAGGTGLFGTGYSLGQIASAASTALSLASKAGLTGDKSSGSFLDTIGAAALNLYSANKAGDTQDKSIATQEASAAQQAKIAQEAWDYHKNTYLPAATKLATDSAALTGKVAGEQNELAAFNAAVEKDAITQGQKSYKYQDEYMRMTDKYVNGEMANTMADESHADVQQAAGLARQSSEMAMQRRGINASSGAGMALRADTDLATAAADAGGQTAARRYARDKAEAMVATAAAAGDASMGRGIQAGNLATGANANAVTASQSGNTVWNGVSNSNAYAGGAAGSNAAGAGQTGYRIGNTYGGSMVADAGAGTLTGLAKGGSGLIDAMGNLTKGMTWNGGSTPSPAQLNSADSNGSWDNIQP